MDKGLKANIEALIKAKRGFEFEAVIREIHLIKFGSDGYQPTRERTDWGAEGLILSTKTITAAYGPDAYVEKHFKKKVTDDFNEFLNNWSSANNNWTMYYNGSLAPLQLQISDDLKTIADSRSIQVDNILIKGIEQILQMIHEDFSNKQVRQLAEYLGVAKELLTFDNLRSLIDDLIKDLAINPENIKYGIQINIKEKIALNYEIEDVDEATSEYEELALNGTLKKVFGILSGYQSEEINSLKFKIITDFNKQRGTFKEKLETLTDLYYNKYSSGNDDEFYMYIRCVLVYCFEQCILGKKTKEELKGETL
ncbi:MAG: hypothetical protein H7239_10100 [Flavobacterium sp.]|nr:hypothetical protein [Flavobacterium sp.]